MSHYGLYLGGVVRTPGVERTVPPERPQDRPQRDGGHQRACLDALSTPRTVAEAAAHLGWDWHRTHSWVHSLLRAGKVQRVGWTKSQAGQRAGQYQRVAA